MGIGGAAWQPEWAILLLQQSDLLYSRKEKHASLCKTCISFLCTEKNSTNGCSEMATALVTGITTLIFNWTMLKYVGEDGVAAITIIMYVLMFVSSLFSGYSYGAAPMISYYYGAQNHLKLKKLVRLSLKIITGISISAALISLLITEPLVSVFTEPASPVYQLAVTGNRICTTALLFIGFNIFSSGMFTALNNGIVSAVLAFTRSFVFMIVCLLAFLPF